MADRAGQGEQFGTAPRRGPLRVRRHRPVRDSVLSVQLGVSRREPIPWLVSDFGLVDAIECGIVKIPRLPVRDDSARRTMQAA